MTKDGIKEAEKLIKKNENMINQDPLQREIKKGGKPDKSFGGERLEQMKEKFSSLFKKNKEGFSLFGKKERKKGGEIGSKLLNVGLDVLYYVFKTGLTIYVSTYYLQLVRAYRDNRMFPGMDPKKSPYTSIGAVEGDDRFKHSILSGKRFTFPYTLRDKDNPEAWVNFVLDNFRDTWIYAKQNADFLIGFTEPATLIGNTYNYKEKEKDVLFNITEVIALFFVVPFLVFVLFIWGVTVAPTYAYLKSFLFIVMENPIAFIPLILFGWVGYFFNALIMPVYLIYFAIFRGYNYMTKGGIKDWAQHYIGKFYLVIFAYIMIMMMMSISWHMGDEPIATPIIIVAAVVTFYILVLGYFEKVPRTIGSVDSAGNPLTFRMPGPEKLNTFLYPAVPKPTAAETMKKVSKVAGNVAMASPKGMMLKKGMEMLSSFGLGSKKKKDGKK